MPLREPEKQLLIALHGCLEAGEAASPEVLERQAQSFLSARRDWTEALPALVDKGLVLIGDGVLLLTGRGKVQAARVRQERPRMYYWYRAYYRAARRSRANAEFCTRLFGRDFAQHGLADTAQVDLLVDALELRPDARVLELGCGNGGIAEYISARTGAHVHGIDFMAEAVRQARLRTEAPGARLSFAKADMNTFTCPPASSDGVIAIDALYFATDLPDLIRRLREALTRQGRLATLYYHNAESPAPEHRRPEASELGRALAANGMPFRTWDLTEADRRHSELKKQLAEELRAQYEAEGNGFIYDNRIAEATGFLSMHEAGTLARYLYVATRGRTRTGGPP